MDDVFAREVVREITRRAAMRARPKFLDGLFKQQLDLIYDPAKRKAALCSRRAGKSHTAAAYALKELQDPTEGDVAYIGLTRSSAKKIIFNPLLKLNRKYNLGLEFNRTELTVTAPSGNTLYVTGAHTEDDTEKLRGFKFKLIILDECASFRAHLSYLIEEVLLPTLIDTDGTLLLIGTPSANPAGNYFYKATEDPSEGFSVHKWTILDNPHIPHAARWLADYRKRKNWDENHPIYRREWKGEWTTDGDSLIYRYSKSRNHYDALPKLPFEYVIGADLGTRDAFTVAVLAFSYSSRKVWVVDQFKKAGMIPDDWAKTLKSYIDEYEPISVVVDHGALGKAICEEFKQRHHLPVKPAEKVKKMAFIELCNGDLLSGAIQIPDQSPLTFEMQMLQRDPDRPSKEDERTPNDLCDAFLYAWREARHYLGEDPRDTPPKGSDEALEAESKRMEEEALAQFEREQSENEHLYGQLQAGLTENRDRHETSLTHDQIHKADEGSGEMDEDPAGRILSHRRLRDSIPRRRIQADRPHRLTAAQVGRRDQKRSRRKPFLVGVR